MNKELFLSTPVHVHLNRMDVLSVNTDISLILFAFFLSLAVVLNVFGGEAALTTVYTINRFPVSTIQHQSPYERLHGIAPAYSLLKVFGCACFVLLQPYEHSKLESRSRLCCFLGYRIEHKGYRCWDPVSKRLRISRHVIFWEHKMFSYLSKFHIF